MLLIAFVTTAVLLGGWLLRSRGLGTGLEGALFVLLLGALLTGTLLLPVAAASLPAAGGLVIAVAVLGMTREVFRRRAIADGAIRPSMPPLDGLEWGCAAVLAVIALATLLRALAPPVESEALIVHLALAKESALEGRLIGIERHPLSNGIDLGRSTRALLYLWHSTLTVTVWQALTAVLAVTALFALVFRLANRRAAFLAAAGFAAMPVVIHAPLTASGDLLAAAFIFAALLALVRWAHEGQSTSGVLGGVLMGGACAAGALGWVALPAWVLAVAMLRPRGLPRSLAYAVTPALAVGFVWVLVASPAPSGLSGLDALRAWLALTGSPPLNLVEAAAAPAWPLPGGRWPFFAWDAIMRPAWFEGPWFSPGPLALAVGLPAMLWCGRDMRRMGWCALAIGLVVMLLHPSARLLMPASALLIAVAATAVERSPRIRRAGMAAFAVAIAYGLVLHGITAADRARVVTGLESRDDFRARHQPVAEAMAWCNEHFEEGLVLSLDPHGFLLESPVFADYAALEAIVPLTVWRQTQWLDDNGIRYIVYPEAAVQADRAMRAAGIPGMLNRWRRTPHRFIQRAAFQRDGETIYIFEVRDVDATF